MRSAFLELDGHFYCTFRDEPYSRALKALFSEGDSRAVSTVLQMEQELLSSQGYPSGSYPLEPIFRCEIEPKFIERGLWALDNGQGSARAVAEWIDKQRIFEKLGMAVVYTVVSKANATTVYLGALTQPSRPDRDILWKFTLVDP